LRRAFPSHHEEHSSYKAYEDIISKAGSGMGAKKWFRHWYLVYDRVTRLEIELLQSNSATYRFLEAARSYNKYWADDRISEIEEAKSIGSPLPKLPALMHQFHVLIAYSSS
jgi:hypothetical protein